MKLNNRTNVALNQIIKKVQNYMVNNHSRDLTSDQFDVVGIKNKIAKFIETEDIHLEGFTLSKLVECTYQEMCEYGILTSFLHDKRVEEININSWEDIKVRYNNGLIKTLTNTFLSAGDARDIIIRLLERESGVKIDANEPVVTSHLHNSIRITASIAPVLDEKRGVQASIRMVNPSKMKKDDFIEYCTLTDEMFDFLSINLFNGVSECIGGATNGGKTTLLSAILDTMPDDLRLITIEEGTREFDLIDKDSEGFINKEVIHWKTHGKFDMNKLLQMSLTCDPDIICPAEMKSGEAYAAQEAARTGHAVISTTHMNSCQAGHKRMVTLCKLVTDLDYRILLELVTEAFPILVYCQKLKDNSRKVMEITESILDPNGNITIQTLYRYVVLKNIKDENGKTIVEGKFEKVNNMSQSLRNRLLANGVPADEIERFIDPALEHRHINDVIPMRRERL